MIGVVKTKVIVFILMLLIGILWLITSIDRRLVKEKEKRAKPNCLTVRLMMFTNLSKNTRVPTVPTVLVYRNKLNISKIAEGYLPRFGR